MKKTVHILFALAAVLTALNGLAQIPSADTVGTADERTEPVSGTAPSGLSASGYVEAYYVQDLNQPRAQERPGFLYNHKRNREVTINLAYLKADYAGERLRATLALQAGTYAQYNYAAELPLLRPILEANAGIKLSPGRNLWFDAGVFASHIGFESAVGKDCWTLTRSLAAENSPYYLAGAKLTYQTPDEKWTLLASVLNGWQRISRPPGYTKPSLSTQVQFRPNSKLLLNWSSFLGSDRPDSLKQTRFFTNLYALINPTGKLGLILGFDLGADRKPTMRNGQRLGSGSYIWYTPVAVIRYAPGPKSYLAGRAEYYDDRRGVIVGTGTLNGFRTWGYSVNYDYAVLPNAVWRIEYRLFSSKDPIFAESATAPAVRTNHSLTTALAIRF